MYYLIMNLNLIDLAKIVFSGGFLYYFFFKFSTSPTAVMRKKINIYVLPNWFFYVNASAVTGLDIISGSLFYKQTKLDSVDI